MQEHRGTAACVSHLRTRGFRVLVTAMRPGSVPVPDVDFTRPTAFLLGNEVDGARVLLQFAARVEHRLALHGMRETASDASWENASWKVPQGAPSQPLQQQRGSSIDAGGLRHCKARGGVRATSSAGR